MSQVYLKYTEYTCLQLLIFWYVVLLYFMCVGAVPECMAIEHVCASCLQETEEDFGSPET